MVDMKGQTRLFVAKGRIDGMNPKKLVMFLEKNRMSLVNVSKVYKFLINSHI